MHEWPQFAKSSIENQLVRSADRIGVNIAEGMGQGPIGANKYHVRMARGALYETKRWLRPAYRRGLLFQEQVDELKPLWTRWRRA